MQITVMRMDIKFLLLLGLIALVGLALILSGRQRADYGSIRPNGGVTEAYEQYQLDPELIYFTSGPSACPRAVIGLDRRFVLASDLWQQRTFNPETFRETVRDMRANALISM